ncbi:MAG: hypothetical protein ABJD68_07600 [Nakamurella sp.]
MASVDSVLVLSSLVLVSDVDDSVVVLLVLLLDVRLVDVLDSELEISDCAAALFTAAAPVTELPQALIARIVAAARTSAAVIVERDLMMWLLRIRHWWAGGS